NEFVIVDPDSKTIAPPFDHARLADALSTAAKTKYTAVTLPFTTFTFIDDERAIQFVIGPAGAGAGAAGGGGRGGGPGTDGPATWKCSIESYTCTPPAAGRGTGRGRGTGGGLSGPVRAPFDVNG